MKGQTSLYRAPQAGQTSLYGLSSDRTDIIGQARMGRYASYWKAFLFINRLNFIIFNPDQLYFVQLVFSRMFANWTKNNFPLRYYSLYFVACWHDTVNGISRDLNFKMSTNCSWMWLYASDINDGCLCWYCPFKLVCDLFCSVATNVWAQSGFRNGNVNTLIVKWQCKETMAHCLETICQKLVAYRIQCIAIELSVSIPFHGTIHVSVPRYSTMLLNQK